MTRRFAVIALASFTSACAGTAAGDPCAVEVDARVRDVADAFSAAADVDASPNAVHIVAPSPQTAWRLGGDAAVISWRSQVDAAPAHADRDPSLFERVVEGKRRFSGDAFAVTVRREGARCPFVAVTPSSSLQLREDVVDMLRRASGRTVEIEVDAAFFIDGVMSGRRQAPVVRRVVVDDGQREARSTQASWSSHGEG